MRHILLVVIYILFPPNIFSGGGFSSSAHAAECGTGKRPLFFIADPKLTSYMPSNFTQRFFHVLDQPLQEIGYCITHLTNSVENDTLMQEELIMVHSVTFSVSKDTFVHGGDSAGGGNHQIVTEPVDDTVATLIVSLIPVHLWKNAGYRSRALDNPLVALVYSPEDPATFESILMKKIVENLRMHYIGHLRIQSIPEGVHIRALTGLEGTTPLEWITPLGKLPIIGELEGFEPIKRIIDLNVPGTHTYVLQMKQRRFFRSGFIIPTVAFAATSVASFGFKYYYYDKYSNLDGNDKKNNPDIFDRYYNRASTFETIGFGALALTGASFTLCFFF